MKILVPGWSWGLWRHFLRFLARSGGDFWRSWGEDGPKMDARGRSWQQVAAKIGHDSAKMTVLGSVWQLLGGSWEHFWLLFSRSLEKWPKCKNEQHYGTFGVFFGRWGLLWRVLEAVLGGFWELCWKMLAPRWCFLSYLRGCLDILAPRLANKSARCDR